MLYFEYNLVSYLSRNRTAEPFIKGEYLSTRDDGIATVKMAWKLADGKPAMAYTHENNVVAVKTSQPGGAGAQPGSTVGLINSITKSECTTQWIYL